MLGISFPELLIILLMAFLLLGPIRLAGFSYDLGRWLRRLKDQLEVFKNTRLNGLDTSALYQARVELDKGLAELNKPPSP